jgi:hypothetical protein
VSALACSATVSDLAVRHEVSRKFVYQQAHKARAALDDAFTATTPDAAVPRNVDHCNATRSTSLQFILYGSFFVRASTWLRQAQPFMYGTKKHRNVNDTDILVPLHRGFDRLELILVKIRFSPLGYAPRALVVSFRLCSTGQNLCAEVLV